MKTRKQYWKSLIGLYLFGSLMLIVACFSFGQPNLANSREPVSIKGLTLVAPPEPFPTNPMPSVHNIGANWVAVIPYAFTQKNTPDVYYNSDRQWWGERPAGVVETIRIAREAGLKIMLKPQVWSHGWWTGDYDFESEQDWKTWEAAYLSYILHYAGIADSLSVDLFCMGTEFKNSINRRPAFWSKVISAVRQVYQGRLTYAANWDNFENIPFWKELDLVGINAYFPLLADKTPDIKSLCKAWSPHVKKIRAFQNKVHMPIAFTEYGYLSVDGCAHQTWVLESQISQLEINEVAQANAIAALHHTFSQEDYWEGGFLWKWFPNMQGHEGYPAKDYTPQGKIAEGVLTDLFKSDIQE